MSREVTAAIIATDAPPQAQPLSWSEVAQRFGAERSYWLATVGGGGRPHVRPVLAVWLDGDRFFSTTSPAARKGRNLARQPDCSLAARAPAIDIVVEGSMLWINDNEDLEKAAAAYQTKYGWPVTITAEGMLDAPYGAPTAGPSPYRVYEIIPKAVYAFGTGDDLGQRSTRFAFTR